MRWSYGTEKVTAELFRDPPAVFRGAPFWAWNGELRKDLLKEQIQVFREMGMGGYHIHSRIGLSTPYLGPEFMDAVKCCCETGKENGLFTWLYDEDKWPSGYGGGRVTENPGFAAKYLLFSRRRYPDGAQIHRDLPPRRVTADGQARLLAVYRVRMKDEKIEHCTMGENGEGTLWFAYQIVTGPLPWFNNCPYVDVLDPEAIERFLQVTHQVYAGAVGEEFGQAVPAIFTDEPQFQQAETIEDAKTAEEAGIPYNKEVEKRFQEMFGYSLLEMLPYLMLDGGEGSRGIRYHYFNVLAECFADAYAGTIGRWCREQGILLTGHVMMEPELESQSRAVGEAMRAYREFGLPGIDMLAGRHEYTTAKQAQSVSRQQSCPGVASEMYGATNWDFDFRGHKHHGDWQAVLGVTLRVPHLAWMYMGGEAKRDYPAPIDGHSPWFRQYHILEDHFARVNLAMTRGRARVRIGVIHPIESFWLYLGPGQENKRMRCKLESQFAELTEWLLFHLYDFDYLAESLLEEQYRGCGEKRLQIGAMGYEAVIVPECITLRKATERILREFQQQGGTVILMGEAPCLRDGIPLDQEGAPEKVMEEGWTQIGFEKDRLLELLEPYRDLEVLEETGDRTKNLIYQMREAERGRWLFLAHGRLDPEVETKNLGRVEKHGRIEIRVRGCFRGKKYDTMDGSITQADCRYQDGWTCIQAVCGPYDSLLYELEAAEQDLENGWKDTNRDWIAGKRTEEAHTQARSWSVRLPLQTAYQLEEDNLLVLDMPRYRLDGGPLQGPEEILKIDDQIRDGLGWARRTDSFPQPWLTRGREEVCSHTVTLLYEIESEICLKTVDLACEGEAASVRWNGKAVDVGGSGHYVDSCIRRICLGGLQEGRNTLEIQLPFGKNTNLERCFLLGNFGVQTRQGTFVIMERPSQILFGDYTRQGLPFYGGNLTYDVRVQTRAGRGILEIPAYSGALVTVSVDGRGPEAAFAEPCQADLGYLEEGEHRLQITVYGNRYNTFGQFHNCDRREGYWGPKTWRTEGRAWTYGYLLRPMGVLAEPILHVGIGEDLEKT